MKLARACVFGVGLSLLLFGCSVPPSIYKGNLEEKRSDQLADAKHQLAETNQPGSSRTSISNRSEAVWQLRKMADAGSHQAWLDLGLATQDPVEAKKWLEKAANSKDPHVVGEASGQLAYKLDQEGKRTEAEVYWIRAADSGYRAALLKLAQRRVEERNFEQASHWYKRAYDHPQTNKTGVLGAPGQANYDKAEAKRTEQAYEEASNLYAAALRAADEAGSF